MNCVLKSFSNCARVKMVPFRRLTVMSLVDEANNPLRSFVLKAVLLLEYSAVMAFLTVASSALLTTRIPIRSNAVITMLLRCARNILLPLSYCSGSFELLVQFMKGDSDDNRTPMRTEMRIVCVCQLFQQSGHLLQGQRIARLDRHFTGVGDRDMLLLNQQPPGYRLVHQFIDHITEDLLIRFVDQLCRDRAHYEALPSEGRNIPARSGKTPTMLRE